MILWTKHTINSHIWLPFVPKLKTLLLVMTSSVIHSNNANNADCYLLECMRNEYNQINQQRKSMREPMVAVCWTSNERSPFLLERVNAHMFVRWCIYTIITEARCLAWQSLVYIHVQHIHDSAFYMHTYVVFTYGKQILTIVFVCVCLCVCVRVCL